MAETPFLKQVIGYTNVFLIPNEAGTRYILVDVGLANDHKKVIRFLDHSGVSFEQIEVLFFTHRHYDHVQGASKLLSKIEATGAHPLVLAHTDEVPFIRDGVVDIPPSLSKLTVAQSALGNSLKHTWLGQKLLGISQVPQIQAWSGDADQLRAMGYPVKIMHTPGHTSGGLSLMVEDHVITGDVCFNFPFAPLRPLFGDDENLLRASWVAFSAKGATTLHPSHGAAFAMERLRAKHPNLPWAG
ncbi:Metallo-beta-lactamase superfamily [Carpediemonas membranifera]|uniref:Metallo-beta-lactamase superfamily n=1 Tax=Carpediemonas membranifera TaxID=201153 RepID=A0A8J6ASI6_9EUKA|nr:Metallo-beta-lactamase superfamily [Carpediemonas membranifera]|eukprot:KAG9391250.1 Metallo-beta-lactamase superfamily [Carpediemonas membranifera]